ncbi:MAG TPA: thiamine-phosphate kinase [Rhizomicrobium sp.]|jgi:thiamine-monophosphate kinase|nr:thiamine-phosphate kinase [Rhizomicrobium sp.]
MARSEFRIIADLFAPLARTPAALGLKDDVALIAPRKGHELVLTTDAIVAGVDFFANDPPDTIARKALRVNLSDLAAKGAEPFGYLLTLALPKTVTQSWLKAFARGLAQDQRTFRIALLGGDLSGTPGPLTVSVTAFGHVPKGKAILRRGARPGDLVFVSGTIGDSGAGLAALLAKKRSPFIARYRVPEPRTRLGPKLRGLATAALDVSDGLIADLAHIADQSQVHIAVEAARVPRGSKLSPAEAATAGDDYEIAFTAPRARRAKVLAAAKAARTPVTEIGFVMPGRGIALLDSAGKPIPLKRTGYRHF